MAIPTVSPFPTPSPARNQPGEVFRPAADATIGHLPTFVAEANAQAAAVDARVQEALDAGLANAAANAAAAAASATQSGNSAAFSTTEANRSRSERQAAEAVRDETEGIRDQAAASAAIAASYTENAAIRMTLALISSDVVIGNGFNGVSAGPVEIASGVVVTVLPGSSWSIV